MNNMFSDNVKRVMQLAREEAARLGSDWRALFQPREHGGEREGRGKLRERHREESERVRLRRINRLCI